MYFSALVFAMVKNEVNVADIETVVTVDVSENSPLLQVCIGQHSCLNCHIFSFVLYNFIFSLIVMKAIMFGK